MVLGTARITEEGINELRHRIGSYFAVVYGNREVTKDAIRHFAEGIGDPNPLWVDEEYAKKTRWGGIITPPIFLYSVIHPTGMRAGGLPGVHSFHAGNDWEWFKPIRLGDRIRGTYQLIDLAEKPSKFSDRTVIQYAEIKYFNQRDELLAKTIGWSIRADRQASQQKGKYAGTKIYKYTEEEIEAIFCAYESEQIRGAIPRYWEDVNVGDDIPPVIKGPFTVIDTIAWKQAVPGGLFGMGMAHGLKLKEIRKHPAFGYRDPKTGSIQTIAEVHSNDEVAQGAAIGAAYDLGSQRNSWMAQPLTHWMGDDGFLKKLYAEYRRFNIYGDTQWIKGKITRKYIENTEHLLDIDIWCENQRREITAPGKATIILPSRERSI